MDTGPQGQPYLAFLLRFRMTWRWRCRIGCSTSNGWRKEGHLLFWRRPGTSWKKHITTCLGLAVLTCPDSGSGHGWFGGSVWAYLGLVFQVGSPSNCWCWAFFRMSPPTGCYESCRQAAWASPLKHRPVTFSFLEAQYSIWDDDSNFCSLSSKEWPVRTRQRSSAAGRHLPEAVRTWSLDHHLLSTEMGSLNSPSLRRGQLKAVEESSWTPYHWMHQDRLPWRIPPRPRPLFDHGSPPFRAAPDHAALAQWIGSADRTTAER